MVVATVLAVATTTLVWVHPWDRSPAPPAEPEVVVTQDDDGVYLQIINRNDTWAIKTTQLKITLVSARGAPVRTYGPDEDETLKGHPEATFHCCQLPYLAPHAEHRFRLHPVPIQIRGARIDIRDPDPWVRVR